MALRNMGRVESLTVYLILNTIQQELRVSVPRYNPKRSQSSQVRFRGNGQPEPDLGTWVAC